MGIIINYDHYRFIVEATSPLKLCFLKYRLCSFDFYVFTLFLSFIVLCIERHGREQKGNNTTAVEGFQLFYLFAKIVTLYSYFSVFSGIPEWSQLLFLPFVDET